MPKKKDEIKMWASDVELVDIDTITPYHRNPRHNDEAVMPLAESMKEHGFTQPILVDKDRVIIMGHTRLKASKLLNLSKIPVIVTDMEEDQARDLRMRDNAVGEIAEWDHEALAVELEDLKAAGGNALDLGFDEGFVEAVLAPKEPEKEEGGEKDSPAFSTAWKEISFQALPFLRRCDDLHKANPGDYDDEQIEELEKLIATIEAFEE